MVLLSDVENGSVLLGQNLLLNIIDSSQKGIPSLVIMLVNRSLTLAFNNTLFQLLIFCESEWGHKLDEIRKLHLAVEDVMGLFIIVWSDELVLDEECRPLSDSKLISELLGNDTLDIDKSESHTIPVVLGKSLEDRRHFLLSREQVDLHNAFLIGELVSVLPSHQSLRVVRDVISDPLFDVWVGDLVRGECNRGDRHLLASIRVDFDFSWLVKVKDRLEVFTLANLFDID